MLETLATNCSDECWDTMPREVAALVLLHLYRTVDASKIPVRAMQQARTGTSQYPKHESFAITGKDLARLSPPVAALICATLFLCDFKWLQVTKRGPNRGAATHVHFGRDSSYGGHAPRIEELSTFRLDGPVLTYASGSDMKQSVIKQIEVPLSTDRYIFVMAE
jgi:hypothetical protein